MGNALLDRIAQTLVFLTFLPWGLCARRATAAEILPFVVKSPAHRTNLGITNLDPTAAQVAISFYDNRGLRAASSSVQVPGLGFLNLSDVVSSLLGTFPDSAVEGFIQLESSNSITAFAAQIMNATNDPGFVSSVRTGASRLFLPVTTSIYPWRSALSVLNLGDRNTTVRVSLRDFGGMLLAALEREIGANHQWISPDIHRELGLSGVRGPLEVESLDAFPLAVAGRHSHVESQQAVFQQPFSLPLNARTFHLPYWRAAGRQRNSVLLSNPNTAASRVVLRSFAPDGRAVSEYATTVPPNGSTLLEESELFGSGAEAPYGLIRGASDLPLGGILMNADSASGDTLHTNLVSELSPEMLVPSATRVSPFLSSLQLSNVGESPSEVEILVRRPDGQPAALPVKLWLPALGTALLEKVLPALGIQDGFYGPLHIRSLQGQPLVAFSQVAGLSSPARGAVGVIDTRPLTPKRQGDPVTVRWHYDPEQIPKILEYRIYRADRASRLFQKLAAVPAAELQASFDATEPGEFLLVVKAFDGLVESNPSNEVILRVEP